MSENLFTADNAAINPEVPFIQLEHPILDTAFRKRIPSDKAGFHYLDFVESSERGQNGEIQLGLQMQKYEVVTSLKEEGIELTDNDLESYKKFGIDVDTLSYSKLIEETVNDRVNELTVIYNRLGWKNRQNNLTKRQRNYEKYFSNWFGPLVEYVNDHADLTRKVWLYNSLIGVTSRRGTGNFIIAGRIIGEYFADSPQFIFKDPAATKLGEIKGLGFYEFGNLGYTSKIFIDPYMDDYGIILGRTARESEPCVGFFEYVRTITSSKNNGITEYVISSQDSIDVIPDETKASVNYYSFFVQIGNKPWWKKLLKL